MRALLAAAVALFALQEASSPAAIAPAEFKDRRAELMKRLADGPVVLEALHLVEGEAGIEINPPRFDYGYLAGYHRDADILVLLPGGESAFLFTGGEPEEVRERTGLRNVAALEDFAAFAAEKLEGAKIVHASVTKGTEKIVALAAPGAVVEGKELARELARLRMVKSEAEIRLIRKATDATAAGHLAAMRACKDDMNEGELQKVIEEAFRKAGGDGPGFPSIIGGGRNGTVLHYSKNSEPMPAGSLVVCDVGASFRGYASDVTRTLPISGKFTEEQRRAYQCVLDAHKAAEGALKAGASYATLELAARTVFVDRGLTKWSYAFTRDVTLFHGISHFVGLALHDTGIYLKPFEAGSIITIEPGYYDKDAGWGIRIEDLYLVTKDGCERLSAGAPREIDEIEKIMAEARKGK